MIATALFGAFALALVHLFAGHIRIPAGVRPAWLSFAGGVSTAYVFIHILPLINRFSIRAGEDAERWQQGEWVFAAALAGTCAYYAVETLIRSHGEERRTASFLIHIGAFAFYNALIGYMLTDLPLRGAIDAIAFYGALALHFAVVDRDLRTRHPRLYDGFGQWIMAGAVLGGAVAGLFEILPEGPMIAGFAFLAGGMMLNVLKEELPAESHGRLLPFTLGAGTFGLLFVLA